MGLKLSARMQREKDFVAKHLGGAVICERCSATLDTYARSCSADLSDACPGFLTIEDAKTAFKNEGLPQ